MLQSGRCGTFIHTLLQQRRHAVLSSYTFNTKCCVMLTSRRSLETTTMLRLFHIQIASSSDTFFLQSYFKDGYISSEILRRACVGCVRFMSATILRRIHKFGMYVSLIISPKQRHKGCILLSWDSLLQFCLKKKKRKKLQKMVRLGA